MLDGLDATVRNRGRGNLWRDRQRCAYAIPEVSSAYPGVIARRIVVFDRCRHCVWNRYRRALKHLDLHGDHTIAIFGQGPVGLSATQVASSMGARVIALDTNSERLKRACELGTIRNRAVFDFGALFWLLFLARKKVTK